MWRQYQAELAPRPRGFHLVTGDLLAAMTDLPEVAVGLAHFFLRHTSASLCLGENTDPDVRTDLERWTRTAVPDGDPVYRHRLEGPDDQPAHIKCGVFGPGLLVPVDDGRLALGTWQGIYLGEHRTHGGRRLVCITLHGETGRTAASG